MSVDFARLNHILIPSTRAGRDRFRTSRLGRATRPLWWLYETLTPEGNAVALMAIFAGIFGLDVAFTAEYQLFCVTAGVFLASILLTVRYRMERVRLVVDNPARVTVGDELTFTLTVCNDGARTFDSLQLFGPFLPWDGKWTGRRARVARLPAHGSAQAESRARFRARGPHHLDTFRVGALVPGGIALGPSVHSQGARFTVVPRLANVAHVAMPSGHEHGANEMSRRIRAGESHDVRGLRPYRVGDRVRDLHARSWARTGTPVVREYQRDPQRRIAVLLDTDRGKHDARAFEALVSLAAGVCANLGRTETVVALVVLGTKTDVVTLGLGTGALDPALDVLATVEPGPALDAATVLAAVSPRLHGASGAVLLTLADDDARRALCDGVRALGMPCRSVVVTSAKSVVTSSEYVQTVAVRAIEQGERIVL